MQATCSCGLELTRRRWGRYDVLCSGLGDLRAYQLGSEVAHDVYEIVLAPADGAARLVWARRAHTNRLTTDTAPMA